MATLSKGKRLFVKDQTLHETVAISLSLGPTARELNEAMDKAEESFEVLRRAGLPEFEISRFKESVNLVAPQYRPRTPPGRPSTALSPLPSDAGDNKDNDSEEEEEEADKDELNVNPQDIYVKGAIERLQMGDAGFASVWKKRWTVVARGMLYCYSSMLRPEGDEKPVFGLRLASHLTVINIPTFAFKQKFEREYCFTVQSVGKGTTEKGKSQRQLSLAFKDEATCINWMKCIERATVAFNLDPPKPSLFKACRHLDLETIQDILAGDNAAPDIVNKQNPYECTPLHYAVKASCNAAKDARKINQNTPELERSFNVVATLMAYGANPHLRDNLGRTCFEIVESMAATMPRTRLTLMDILKSSRYEFDGEGTVYIFPADLTKLKRRIAGHLTQELNEMNPPSFEHGAITFQLRPEQTVPISKGAKNLMRSPGAIVATTPASKMSHVLQSTMGATAQKTRAIHHGALSPGFSSSLYPHQKLPTAAQTKKVGTLKDVRDPLASFYLNMAVDINAQQMQQQKNNMTSNSSGQLRPKTVQGAKHMPGTVTWGPTSLSKAKSEAEVLKITDGFRPITAPADPFSKTVPTTSGPDGTMVVANKGSQEIAEIPYRGRKTQIPPMSNGEANRIISFWRATHGVPRAVKEILEKTIELDERSSYVAFSEQKELIDAFRALIDDPTTDIVPNRVLKEFLTKWSEILTAEEIDEMIEEADPTGSGFVNFVRFIKHMHLSRIKPLPDGVLFNKEDDPIFQLKQRKIKERLQAEKRSKIKVREPPPLEPHTILFKSQFQPKKV